MQPSDKTQRRLEGLVEAVTDSYGEGRAIDSLETTALPNSRKVCEALSDLEHVAYMGFYSTRVLSPLNLRHHIAEHLQRATETLVEQIARAVAYQRHRGGMPGPDEIAWSEEVVMDTLEQLPRLRALLALDVQAAYEGDPAASSIEEIVFSYPAVQAITVYRIAHELFVRHVPMVPRIMAEHAHSKTGIEIHPGATIGRSFFIDHGTGVVIGATAVIGDRVKLYQHVTLGALSVPRARDGERPAQRHPTIEDDVTVYAGASIFGGQTVIGRGATIGANCWITRSVAPGTRVTFSTAEDGDETSGVDRSSGRQTFASPPPPPDKPGEL
jgi:serine O-acetyltransferase